MAFMQPQITDKARWLKGEAKDGGTWFAPSDQFSKVQFGTNVLGYRDHELLDSIIEAIEEVTGWGVRLSAPGFLDCTDWEVFTDHDEAHARYMELRDEQAEQDEAEQDDEDTLVADAAHAVRSEFMNRRIALTDGEFEKIVDFVDALVRDVNLRTEGKK